MCRDRDMDPNLVQKRSGKPSKMSAIKIPSVAVCHRRLFFRATKQCTETVSDWYNRLKVLAEPCLFGKDLNTFLLEVFISGLEDVFFERLLEEKCDVTFDIAYDVITKYERSLLSRVEQQQPKHEIKIECECKSDGDTKSYRSENNGGDERNEETNEKCSENECMCQVEHKSVDEDNNIIEKNDAGKMGVAQGKSNGVRYKTPRYSKSRKWNIDKRLYCEMCPDRSFNHKANLRRHMESTHAKQITRSCHICGRTFSSDTAVLKHIRVHTGEKPYACEFCSKKFSRLDKMKEHKNIHLGVKLHGCNLCEKRYTQRCNLKVHMLSVHMKEKNFTCIVCAKSFVSAPARKLHMKSHDYAKYD